MRDMVSFQPRLYKLISELATSKDITQNQAELMNQLLTELDRTSQRMLRSTTESVVQMEEALKRDGKLREEFISKFSSEVKANLKALETATDHLKSNIRKYMLTLTGISVGCSLVAWALLQLWLR